jgi:hypothetical protein
MVEPNAPQSSLIFIPINETTLLQLYQLGAETLTIKY